LSNDELGIGTSTWCGEFEELVGTAIERHFFEYASSFYETSVSKMIAKFPFDNEIIHELG